MNTNFGAKLSHKPKIFLLSRALNPPGPPDKKTDPSTELGVMGLFLIAGEDQSLISTLTRFPHSAEAALMTVRMALAMRP